MEKLLAVLEEARRMTERPNARVEVVIAHIRERLQEIENPHLSLERELEHLVERKKSPNGELYSRRPDKSE